MAKEKDIVKIAGRKPALSSPSFIIEKDVRFYVTVAVVEYDPQAADLTAEQKKGVAEVQTMFEQAQQQQGSATACPIEPDAAATAMNTGPHD